MSSYTTAILSLSSSFFSPVSLIIMFPHGTQHVRQTSHHSPSHELLFIPANSSQYQDLGISLDNSLISTSVTAHNLRVTMYNHLSFYSHIANFSCSCQFLLFKIGRICPFLSTQASQVLVWPLVISRLDYYYSSWQVCL